MGLREHPLRLLDGLGANHVVHVVHVVLDEVVQIHRVAVLLLLLFHWTILRLESFPICIL